LLPEPVDSLAIHSPAFSDQFLVDSRYTIAGMTPAKPSHLPEQLFLVVRKLPLITSITKYVLIMFSYREGFAFPRGPAPLLSIFPLGSPT